MLRSWLGRAGPLELVEQQPVTWNDDEWCGTFGHIPTHHCDFQEYVLHSLILGRF